MNSGWKRFAVVLAVGTMLTVGLVGCNETEISESEAVDSEVVSEVVSEEVSEEVFEPVSEETSEVVSEIVDGVQMVYYETYDEFCGYLDTIDDTVFVEYSFEHPGKTTSGQAIIYNNAHYTLREDSMPMLISSKTIANITSPQDYVEISNHGEWRVFLIGTGEDRELSLTISYDDGTEETLCFYFTKLSYSFYDEEYINEPYLEIEGDGEITYYENDNDFLDYYKTADSNNTAIAVHNLNEEQQAILYNGSHCTTSSGIELHLSDNGISKIIAPGWISAQREMVNGEWTGLYAIEIEDNLAVEVEIPLDIYYENGTQEKFMVYIHYKEW